MSSISYDGIIPTECKCNLPLIEHTSWTLTNPCRRFLVCPNRYKAGVRKCNKFVWYDPELDNSWYREHLYHMYGQEILKRLVPNGFEKVYYCKSGAKLTSIREIKSDQDIVDMLKVGYDNGFQIDMYVDHFGYDIMEMVEYDRNEELRNTIWSEEETPQVDPDDNQIDPVYKVKKGVVYPAFDPDIPWDKMEPILGMRFETPHQLKMALANYGVAHGYQLWYMKNDQRQVWFNSGTIIEEVEELCRGDEGNQASKKPVKKPIKKLVKKPVKKIPDSQSGEGTSKSPKWTKKQILNSKKVNCPFRLYASWMSREHSFQIKSLRSEHKCCRNYNLGSLVTYKWIVVQYFKEIIENQILPLRAGGKWWKCGGRSWMNRVKRGGGKAGKSIHSQPTQQSGVWVVDTTVSVADVDEAPEQETSDDGPAVDKGKAKASVEDGPAPEQGISIKDGPTPKKKRGRLPSSVDGIRIYHKNRDRSERIANIKSNKPFHMKQFGTGSYS
ncbi:hypothetical protein Tco_0753338 [Tanacetum coccineum]